MFFNVSFQMMFKGCNVWSLLFFLRKAIPCQNRRRKKGVKNRFVLEWSVRMPFVSKIVVSCFLNQ